MANVKVSSLEQVSQMAAVVALATEQVDEISQNSQVNYGNLTNLVGKWVNDCGSISMIEFVSKWANKFVSQLIHCDNVSFFLHFHENLTKLFFFKSAWSFSSLSYNRKTRFIY